jgi:phosphate:Na+ symporter
MADLLAPLKGYQPFMEMMQHTANPLYGIFIGFAFTFLIHSSGATSGIVIAMALAGAITLEQAIPINLGAMIGTCVTAVMSAIGRSREGKRVAIWHVIHQTAGVVLALPFITLLKINGEPVWFIFVKWFTRQFFGAAGIARQIAMGHTLISLISTLVFLPLLPMMNRLLNALYPPKDEEKPFGPIYIEEGLLSEPAIAMEQARKEIVRQGELVQEMLRETLEIFETQNLKLCDTVSLKDIRVDALHAAIVHYLSRVSQEQLSEPLAEMQVKLLYITADIEEIGDIIDKNIVAISRKKLENKLWFSEAGWQDIIELHGYVLSQFSDVLTALRNWDVPLSARVIEDKHSLSRRVHELRRKHIERISQGVQDTIETAGIHQDLIDQLKHINSHTASIAGAIHGRI